MCRPTWTRCRSDSKPTSCTIWCVVASQPVKSTCSCRFADRQQLVLRCCVAGPHWGGQRSAAIVRRLFQKAAYAPAPLCEVAADLYAGRVMDAYRRGMSLELTSGRTDVQPNYMRVWAGLFSLVLYLRPAAIVGVGVAAGVAYFNLGLSTGSYQLEPEVRLFLLAWRWLGVSGIYNGVNQHEALSMDVHMSALARTHSCRLRPAASQHMCCTEVNAESRASITSRLHACTRRAGSPAGSGPGDDRVLDRRRLEPVRDGGAAVAAAGGDLHARAWVAAGGQRRGSLTARGAIGSSPQPRQQQV